MAAKTVLDTSAFQAYKKMGRSCRYKNLEDFHVLWPRLSTAKDMAEKGFAMRYMRAGDIGEVVEMWKDVYPEAAGSSHQFVFDPRWLRNQVLLEENQETGAREKIYAIIVLEQVRDARLKGVLLLTKTDRNLQIELTMGGLHSTFRNQQVFFPFFQNILDALETTGAQLLTVFAETWHTKTQQLMDYHGFKIWGLFPGNMMRWSHGNKCYRACEVHYYKFINQGEQYATGPEEWELSEKSRELWKTLEKLNRQGG